MKIILTDTFNDRQISTHSTVEAAVKALRRNMRAVKKTTGSARLLDYEISAENGSDSRRIGREWFMIYERLSNK